MKDFIVTFWDGTTAEVRAISSVEAGLKYKGQKLVFAVIEK